MAPAVMAGAATLGVTADAVPFREVSGARGVADVVFAQFDPAATTARDPAQAAVADLSSLRCLLALSAGAGADGLPDLVGVTRSHLVRSVLPRLATQGWVLRDARAGWQLARPYRPAAYDVVVVELKRTDWRGALRQASWYIDAADASWVVLDGLRVQPALAAEAAFRHAGVGLASVAAYPPGCRRHGQPDVTVHLRPAPHKPPRPDAHALLSENCLALWLQGQTAGPSRHVFGRLLEAGTR
jgi:hypothetical protein